MFFFVFFVFVVGERRGRGGESGESRGGGDGEGFFYVYLFILFLSFFLSSSIEVFVLRVSDLDSDVFPFLLSRGKNTTARNAPERGVSTVHVVPVQEFVVEEVERHHGALVFGVLLRGFAGCRGEYFSRISKQMVDRKSKEEVVRTH